MNFEQKKCIFTLFGATSWITRRSSSDTWGHSKKSGNTFLLKIHSNFTLNSLVFEIHSLKVKIFTHYLLESTPNSTVAINLLNKMIAHTKTEIKIGTHIYFVSNLYWNTHPAYSYTSKPANTQPVIKSGHALPTPNK